jgi:hypothetical protein
MLNNGVVQNGWVGACSGRTGNVHYSPKALHHSCEENGLNRWHCILSRLEYEIRKTRHPSVVYIAPDAVDYPAVVRKTINMIIQQSNLATTLQRPIPTSPLRQVLQIANPNETFSTVHEYVRTLYQKTNDDDAESDELIQAMDSLQITKNLLNLVGDIDTLKLLQTRLIAWCKLKYQMNPNMRQKIDECGREKDRKKSITKLVLILDKSKRDN